MQTEATSPVVRIADAMTNLLIFLTWLGFGRAIAIVRSETFELEGGHDALDDLRHPAGHVVTGNGYVVHPRWVHPHSIDSCDRDGPDPRYSGSYSRLKRRFGGRTPYAHA